MKLFDVIFNKLPDDFKTEIVLKSVSDQLKLLAWAMSGINYLINSSDKMYGLIFIVPSWLFCQYLAAYVLARIETGEK